MALPGTEWRVWRWACLRGAGFPTELVGRLVAVEGAAAADRLLVLQQQFDDARTAALEAFSREAGGRTGDDATALRDGARLLRKGRVPADSGSLADAALAVLRNADAALAAGRDEFAATFEASRMAVLDAARELARDPRLREAVTWQNRAAVQTGFDSLARSLGRSSKICKKEALVASYVQRYATKNDSIGFFGPIGWAKLETSGPPLAVSPGAQLIASRSVHFEQWPIDALASKLTADPRYAHWMVPRRHPFVRLAGSQAASLVSGRHDLTPEQALVLAACDGESAAITLAEQLLGAHPSTFGTLASVFTILERLREMQLVAWAFEVPLSWDPEGVLRAMLERIGDEALRDEALRPLDALDAARVKVARSAGDAVLLAAALGEIEDVFTTSTGLSPTRQAGMMYAARQLVFEDCRRDVDVAIGPDLLARIAPALALALASARWLTFEVGKVYGERLRGIYDDLARRARSTTVPFSELMLRAQRLFYGAKDKPLTAVLADLRARWARVLSLPDGARDVRLTSAELAPRVRDAFAAPRPGWVGARYQAPDILIAADGVEAIERGDFLVVLGELHVANNTLDASSFYAQHPCPVELDDAFASDIPELFVRPVDPKDWPKSTARLLRALRSPSSLSLESGFERGRAPRDRALAASDLEVHGVDGELVVLTPRGDRIPLVDAFGELLSRLVEGKFRLLADAPHTPRVTIDQLVVSRESWSMLPSAIDFADAKDDAARFLGARAWARARGIPRFAYAKSALEEKPIYVDFDAPALVNVLARLARRAREDAGGEKVIVLSEMLPTLDQTWLTDSAGKRFTSELRMIFVDGAERRP